MFIILMQVPVHTSFQFLCSSVAGARRDYRCIGGCSLFVLISMLEVPCLCVIAMLVQMEMCAVKLVEVTVSCRVSILETAGL